MAPKGRKAGRQIYDSFKVMVIKTKFYSCKIRLTTANFEPCVETVQISMLKFLSASKSVWDIEKGVGEIFLRGGNFV